MEQQPYRKLPIPGRNAPCPCGSGKKIKYCCLDKIRALVALPPHLCEQHLVAQILQGSHTMEPAYENDSLPCA